MNNLQPVPPSTPKPPISKSLRRRYSLIHPKRPPCIDRNHSNLPTNPEVQFQVTNQEDKENQPKGLPNLKLIKIPTCFPNSNVNAPHEIFSVENPRKPHILKLTELSEVHRHHSLVRVPIGYITKLESDAAPKPLKPTALLSLPPEVSFVNSRERLLKCELIRLPTDWNVPIGGLDNKNPNSSAFIPVQPRNLYPQRNFTPLTNRSVDPLNFQLLTLPSFPDSKIHIPQISMLPKAKPIEQRDSIPSFEMNKDHTGKHVVGIARSKTPGNVTPNSKQEMFDKSTIRARKLESRLMKMSDFVDAGVQYDHAEQPEELGMKTVVKEDWLIKDPEDCATLETVMGIIESEEAMKEKIYLTCIKSVDMSEWESALETNLEYSRCDSQKVVRNLNEDDQELDTIRTAAEKNVYLECENARNYITNQRPQSPVARSPAHLEHSSRLAAIIRSAAVSLDSPNKAANQSSAFIEFDVVRTICELDNRLSAVDKASTRLEEDYRRNQELLESIVRMSRKRDIGTSKSQNTSDHGSNEQLELRTNVDLNTSNGETINSRTRASINHQQTHRRTHDQETKMTDNTPLTTGRGRAKKSQQRPTLGEPDGPQRTPRSPSLSLTRKREKKRADRRSSLNARRRDAALKLVGEILSENSLPIPISENVARPGPLAHTRGSLNQGKPVPTSPQGRNPADRARKPNTKGRGVVANRGESSIRAFDANQYGGVDGKQKNKAPQCSSDGPGTATAIRDADEDQHTTVLSEWSVDSDVKKILVREEVGMLDHSIFLSPRNFETDMALLELLSLLDSDDGALTFVNTAVPQWDRIDELNRRD